MLYSKLILVVLKYRFPVGDGEKSLSSLRNKIRLLDFVYEYVQIRV